MYLGESLSMVCTKERLPSPSATIITYEIPGQGVTDSNRNKTESPPVISYTTGVA